MTNDPDPADHGLTDGRRLTARERRFMRAETGARWPNKRRLRIAVEIPEQGAGLLNWLQWSKTNVDADARQTLIRSGGGIVKASTRARELLIVPRPSSGVAGGSWLGVIDLALSDLPALDRSAYEPVLPASAAPRANQQTRELFATEASRIVEATRSLHWKSPSRHEDADKPEAIDEVPVVVAATEEVEAGAAAPAIQGGRVRGLVMHKLAEEILTGEVAEEAAALGARARELLAELGTSEAESVADGLVASEVAGAILRAFQLPEVLAVRGRLIPECHVYAFASDGNADTVTYGIADAIAFDGAKPTLVIDWKSDVTPDAATILAYRGQVGDYLKATGVPVGLIVFPTTGRVEQVEI